MQKKHGGIKSWIKLFHFYNAEHWLYTIKNLAEMEQYLHLNSEHRFYNSASCSFTNLVVVLVVWKYSIYRNYLSSRCCLIPLQCLLSSRSLWVWEVLHPLLQRGRWMWRDRTYWQRLSDLLWVFGVPIKLYRENNFVHQGLAFKCLEIVSLGTVFPAPFLCQLQLLLMIKLSLFWMGDQDFRLNTVLLLYFLLVFSSPSFAPYM